MLQRANPIPMRGTTTQAGTALWGEPKAFRGPEVRPPWPSRDTGANKGSHPPAGRRGARASARRPSAQPTLHTVPVPRPPVARGSGATHYGRTERTHQRKAHTNVRMAIRPGQRTPLGWNGVPGCIIMIYIRPRSAGIACVPLNHTRTRHPRWVRRRAAAVHNQHARNLPLAMHCRPTRGAASYPPTWPSRMRSGILGWRIPIWSPNVEIDESQH